MFPKAIENYWITLTKCYKYILQRYEENLLKIDWNMIELGMELSWTKWAGQAAAAVPVEAQGLEFINQILGLLLLLLVESE